MQEIKIRRGGDLVNAIPSNATLAEIDRLQREIGEWDEANDCDLLGKPTTPDDIARKEDRLERLYEQTREIRLAGTTGVVFEARDGGVSLVVEIRNVVDSTDPMGYEPVGREVCVDCRVDGEAVGTPRWCDPSEIEDAAKEWQGTNGIEERVYSLAAKVVRIALDRTKSARFDGYTYA